jgi:hypothetical protein
MAVHNVGTKTSELAKNPHESFGEWSLTEHNDGNTLGEKLLAERAQIAVSNYRNIVPVLSLKAAELSYEDLRPAHLKTVDNVNDLHAERCVNSIAPEKAKKLNSNLHNTNCFKNSQTWEIVIPTKLRTLKRPISDGLRASLEFNQKAVQQRSCAV